MTIYYEILYFVLETVEFKVRLEKSGDFLIGNCFRKFQFFVLILIFEDLIIFIFDKGLATATIIHL